MPETIVRRSKVKNEKPTKIVKTVDTPTKPPTSSVSTTQQKTTKTVEKYSVVSDNKIKKILDEYRINRNVITVINKIKSAIVDNKEFKTVLTDQEVDIVGEYFESNKKKLKKEEENGKKRARENKTTFHAPSTNQIALRAFMDQKYKFKRELSQYLAIICDLMIEEIIQTTREHVININKKLVNVTHIVPEQLSDKLLYPLYCKLPSFVALSKTDEPVTQVESTETSEETTEPVSESSSSTWSEEEQKMREGFKGTVKVIFNKFTNEEGLKIKKPYQLFLSNLVIEFLDRMIHPLLVTVNNTSRNKVIVKNTASTIVEYIMSDYSWDQNRYSELWDMIKQRSHNHL